MILRFAVALVLGALLGLERELVGKEAGIRTEMLVAGGASIFAMIGLMLPYIAASMSNSAVDISAQSNSFGIIANIVVGIGFLGAGLIIKTGDRPHGITTAALVWTTAAIGVLAGVGMTWFAVAAAVILTVLLYMLRKLDIAERMEKENMH
jgi:putative Mg2+ transporter-C (MgtC) family protein